MSRKIIERPSSLALPKQEEEVAVPATADARL
jgi:hypothetical protein